jgi:hypothetical protein
MLYPYFLDSNIFYKQGGASCTFVHGHGGYHFLQLIWRYAVSQGLGYAAAKSYFPWSKNIGLTVENVGPVARVQPDCIL